jgi:hypothetical protein
MGDGKAAVEYRDPAMGVKSRWMPGVETISGPSPRYSQPTDGSRSNRDDGAGSDADRPYTGASCQAAFNVPKASNGK